MYIEKRIGIGTMAIKTKYLYDDEGLDLDGGEEAFTTRLMHFDSDTLFFQMYTEDHDEHPIYFTRREARQLRNWLNKALEQNPKNVEAR